jgi:uncharacterized repeat protein (TIGR01451 family)
MFFKRSLKRRRPAKLLSKRQRSGRNLHLEPLEDRRLLSLIGVTLPWNLMTYDSGGHLSYDPASHAYNADATPLLFKGTSTGTTRPVVVDPATSMKSVQIRINVDNAGNLIGGQPGPDLLITGSIATIGAGTLLTGEISQFGWSDTPTTDTYDFRFTPTGGLLQSYFNGKDIGVITNSETSTFNGNFSANFNGTAKGFIGSIAPLLSSLSGNVYVDVNNNGQFEPGLSETGIANTTVRLTGTNVDGVAVNQTVLTDINGTYHFTSLRPGTYTLTETQPARYLDGIDTIGTPGGAAGNDVFSNIVLAAGVNGVNNNFGELPMLPGIQLVKLTNGGHDPNVPVGDPVTWTYEVSNTGNVALSGVTVSDDQGVIPLYDSGDTNLDGKLDTNEMWIFTASGAATAGQYANVGTAVGTATDASGAVHVTVSTTDVDHYFGVNAQLQLVKFTNNRHNPNIEAGSGVTWTYEITNPGNVALINLSVTDNQGVIPAYVSGDDGNNQLDPGEKWIYEATGMAIVGQYMNTGTATAYDATETLTQPLTVTGDDSYFGVQPGIQIIKLTNGADNLNKNVVPGSDVTWTYNVTNTGNVALNNVAVIDDQGVTPVYDSGDNGNGLLDVSETWTFTAGGTAVAGQYYNTATAAGTDDTGTVTTPVTASEGDSYFGVAPAIQIVKLTNGSDNLNKNVAAGSDVTWTYNVANNGNVALKDVAVDDSTPGVTPFLISGDNGNGLLDVGETWVYAAIGTAVTGQYYNTGTASGVDATDTIATPVSASEGDSYFGVAPSIQIVKLTNGTDNLNKNMAPGSDVTWTYNVTNTGNVALTVAVTDSVSGVTPAYDSGDDGNGLFDPGETWVFTASGTAIAGQYNNTGTAVGTDATGTVTTPVTASEGDSYFGVQPGIQIVKLTNGTDNNSAPGAQVVVGSTVTWTFNVTNTGNVALNNVTVADSDLSVALTYSGGDNGNDLLDVGEMWVYTATAMAIAGQHSNTGTASGADATGTVTGTVSSSDVDYYYGAAQEPASKSGYVYVDDNNDGIKQAGEAGIKGVKIILTGTNDLGQSVNITATTDANGYYIFASLRPGTYTVTEVQPTSSGGGGGNHDGGGCGDHKAYMYQWCEGGIRHFELHNSDGSTREYNSSSNSSLLDNLFAQLDGHDWTSDNFNWDDEDLTDALFRGNDPSKNCNSGDSDDHYFVDHFADFWDGISVMCGRNGSTYYLDGKDTAGSDGGTVGNDVISNIVLNWGDHGTDNNFGELLPASVSGNVYVDSNNDGIKQSTEKGISRVKVTLTGVDDLGNAIELTTVTDCNGAYNFGNLRPGTYTLTETQPACYLDGKDAIGTQGGVAGNDVLSSIVLASGVKGAGNNFGELKAASLSGFVYLDKNGNGDIDCRDRAIAGVTVTLTGVDDLGNSISLTTVTDDDGAYAFKNLRPGTYTITETQPADYMDGIDTIGSQGGTVGNDQFSNIVLNQGVRGVNNNFAELPSANSALHEGQTATIGFWNSCRGQSLIKSLNGGCNSTQLGNWLATMFPNMYGATTGSRNLAGKTNAQIARFFQQLFDVHGMKIDAQALAVALAVYVTNSNLAGNVAAGYGFVVSSMGTGAATFNIGNAGVAFNVANYSTLSISQILQKTNEQARKGILWDLNGNGSISSAEQALRTLANALFTDINETGDIG